jgi:hypothetical protein
LYPKLPSFFSYFSARAFCWTTFERALRDAIRGSVPGVEAWLQWVFAVIGGQMAACGVIVMNRAG